MRVTLGRSRAVRCRPEGGALSAGAAHAWSGPEVRGLVLRAVRTVWENGYQPADVLRVARRQLGEPDVALLRSVLAAELATYPRGTVDRRWLGQVADPDGAQSAPPTAVPWTAVARRAEVLVPLLAGLPRLERLGLLPGSVPEADGATAAPVDARILERVRALLAKAESTTFPEEAETFTAGAQALMARHRIDAAMLEARRGGPRGGPDGVRLGVEAPYESAKVALLTAVASANRCRTVWTRSLGFCTVVGFAADLEVVETLFTSLLVQATRAVTREGPRVDGSGRSRTRAFRHAFLLAFAQRIGERLAQESARFEHDAASAPGGEGLLPVLAARDADVDRVLAQLFPRVRYSRSTAAGDAEGWASGRAAADLADFGASDRLDGRRS
jgi:hypothetical protein